MTEEDRINDANWDLVQRAIEKAESLFEEKITYIASGALVLFIGFVENIVTLDTACFKILVVLSWGFIGSCLLSNLFSQLVSKKHLKDTQQDYEDKLERDDLIERVKSRNVIIEYWNKGALALLTIGILLFVVFISLNILK